MPPYKILLGLGILGVVLVFSPSHLAGAPETSGVLPPANLQVQEAFSEFLTILGPENLATLVRQMGENNPGDCQQLLLTLHESMTPTLFSQMVLIWTGHPDFLERFLKTAVAGVNVAGFSKLLNTLSDEPATMRQVVLESLKALDDKDLVPALKSTTRHPESLKTFALSIDNHVAAEFAKNTFADVDAMTLIIASIQENPDQIKQLAPGVDLYKIAGKVLLQIDKAYFKELLLPENVGFDQVVMGMSLTDGIIDVKNEEKIDIKGVNKQVIRMLDSPGFILSFIWNIYFGDQTSQIAFKFRKTLLASDEGDGQKDGVVNLRSLNLKNPELFNDLYNNWAALLNVSRFQDQLRDPHILIDPLLAFLPNHPPGVVAETITPIFIRSLEIRPQLAQVVNQELPAVVMASLLDHIVTYMGQTEHGRKTLKNLVISIWEQTPDRIIGEIVIQLNRTNPQSIYDLVVPIFLSLSPEGLRTATVVMTKNPEIFYRYNGQAIRILNPGTLSALGQMVHENSSSFYRVAQDVIAGLPRQKQNEFLWQVAQNPSTKPLVKKIITGLDPIFLKDLGSQIEKAPPRSKKRIQNGFPASIVEEVVTSYKEKTAGNI